MKKMFLLSAMAVATVMITGCMSFSSKKPAAPPPQQTPASAYQPMAPQAPANAVMSYGNVNYTTAANGILMPLVQPVPQTYSYSSPYINMPWPGTATAGGSVGGTGPNGASVYIVGDVRKGQKPLIPVTVTPPSALVATNAGSVMVLPDGRVVIPIEEK